MSEKIFETMVKKPKSTLKWLFFPVSLLFHGLLIAGIIVVPLMSEGSRLPAVKVCDHWVLMAPAPPQTPSPPKGKRGGSGGDGETKPRPVKPKPSTQKRFVPPIDIPGEIPEEKFDDIVASMHPGDDSGVVGGVIGIDTGIGPSILGPGSNDGCSSPQIRLTHVQPPRLIKRVAPIYPLAPIKAHIEGVVSIEAVTDIYGRVVKVRVISGHPLLRHAAVQAVKQWIYEPYILNGIPRPVTFTVNVNFKLQR